MSSKDNATRILNELELHIQREKHDRSDEVGREDPVPPYWTYGLIDREGRHVFGIDASASSEEGMYERIISNEETLREEFGS